MALVKLQVCLLGQEQGIINFNAEVSDRALELGMAQQQLTGTKVAGSLVDQRNFCPPQAVRSVERGIEADQGDPAIEKRPYCLVGLARAPKLFR